MNLFHNLESQICYKVALRKSTSLKLAV